MIRLNDFRRQWHEIGAEVRQTVERVGANGWYILGDEVKKLEHDLARLFGLKQAVTVGSGHDALEIGLRCVGVGPGCRVLTTPLSAFATTQAILRAGGEPVFVDVDDRGLLDHELCREALAEHPDIRFLLPVHLFGRPLNLDAFAQLASDFELTIIEDCAQSIGASRAEQLPGSIGRVAATSFYPTKNLGALGDGGALLTDCDHIARRAASLRHGGRCEDGTHVDLGCCSRLDELHAAILRTVMLPHLDTWLERRRHNARFLAEEISHPSIRISDEEPAANPSWHIFPIRVEEGLREDLRGHLQCSGIESGVHYPRLITDEPAIDGRPDVHPIGGLDAARRWAATELSLPVHPFLSRDELMTIATTCNTWDA